MRQQDYLEVSAATDRSSFEHRLVDFAQKMNFCMVTAALAIEQPGEKALFVRIGNTPREIEAAAVSMENTRRDPVFKRLKESHLPITYDQSLYVEEDAGDLWETFAPFGYRTGIAMALHLPAGKHFLLGVDRNEPLPSDDGQLTRLLADLQLLAVYAQETAIRVLGPVAQPQFPPIHLTPREREVLQWTREGKSAWAVGQILSMSEHTVNFHLRNVMRKLGVSGKHMAMLRAMTLGLL
ncbi:MAG: autoinducer binding domain-containing protein [Burkholderiales bacterium]|nr:autoinducer binding domain-containing protein [Burkholderiales bacterium]MDE1929861.1 autoinducer binding domain-containing protein [Burkholderiales bacterium]MDE2160306.1 autoinducer binding domain-containing protein [Burkholderiales bacterium]